MTPMTGQEVKTYQRCFYLFNAFYAIISICLHFIIIYNAGQVFLLISKNIFPES